jgi:hypothetical protein
MLTTIAADPKHLGAEIGVTAVLHTGHGRLAEHVKPASLSPGIILERMHS